MHSVGERSFRIFTFGILILTLSAIGLIFSSVTLRRKVGEIEDAAVEAKVLWLRGHLDKWTEKRAEVAQVYFNASADFGPLFNWNVKYVFVYIMVEYGAEESLNHATIWDLYITRGEYPKLNIYNGLSKYILMDAENILRGQNARIILRWNVICNTGALLEGTSFGPNFQFPADFTS